MKNITIFIALSIIFNYATAASFDCQKATTSNEKAICDNPTLSALDIELSAVYKGALAATVDNNSIRDSQRAWLKDIKSCESKPDQIVECLTTAYTARLSSLKQSANSSALPVAQPIVATTSNEPKQTDSDAAKPSESSASNAIQTSSAEPSALPSALNQPPKAIETVATPKIFESLMTNKLLIDIVAALMTLLLIFLPRLFGPRAPN